jgi:hypothetical protein
MWGRLTGKKVLRGFPCQEPADSRIGSGALSAIVPSAWFTVILADGCGLNVATSSERFREAATASWAALG